MIFDKSVLGNLEELLTVKGKKYIIYHRDSDGVCSAAQIMKVYKGFRGLCREGPILDDSFIKFLILSEPKVIVFVDLPVDQHHEKLIKLKEKTDAGIAIIDHHPFEKDMNSEGIIHINNMFLDDFKDSYIPASCIIWRLLGEMGNDSEPYSWIAGIGVIGDYGPKECMDVIKSVRRQNPELVKGEIMKCSLSNGSDMISASITVRGLKGADYSLKLLRKSESFYDFVSDDNLIEWNGILQSEVARLADDFRKNKEIDEKKKLIFYEIKSDLSISSIISTVVSEMYSTHVIVIYKKWNDSFKVSMRCQDGHVDVGELGKKCSEGIGTGGGHRKAAGAFINSDWDTFRKRAIDFIS